MHSFKAKYARNGALIGAALFIPDLLLEWREPQFLPWTQLNFIAHNLGIFGGAAIAGALIGLAWGAFADMRREVKGRR